MKAVNTVLKVLAALAAVAGAVYVIATYGDKIVAWAKKLLDACPCKCCDEPICEECDFPEGVEEVPVEEVPVEEAPVEEPVPVEVIVEDGAVVADEADFEG